MNWLWVAMGGAIGASLRYGTSLVLLKPGFSFPWATWSVNLLGCFCAGVFFACSQKYPALQQEARLFLMVGILGGFTTFSSFGLESFQLIKQNQLGLAVLYVVSSVLLGVLLLFIAYALSERVLSSW